MDYEERVRRINSLVQKKQLHKAKPLFVGFMTFMRKDRQCIINWQIVEYRHLIILDKAYKKIWAAGVQFKTNLEEWAMVSFLGWLHMKHSDFEMSSKYFEEWHNLLLRHLKKYQTTPNYKFFYENLQDYFEFLLQNHGYRRGIQAVDEILWHTKATNEEIHAYFLATKGRLYRTKGNISKALKYLLRAIEIQERQPILQTAEIDHYKCLEDVALLFSVLNRHEYALKYHLKVHKKVNSEAAKIHNVMALLEIEKGDVRSTLSLSNMLYISKIMMDQFDDHTGASIFLESAKESLNHEKFMKPAVFESLNPEYEKLQKECELLRNSIPHDKIAQLHLLLDFTISEDIANIEVIFNEVKIISKTLSKLSNVPQETKFEFLNEVFDKIRKFQRYEMHLEAIEVLDCIIPQLTPYQNRATFLLEKAGLYTSGGYFGKGLNTIQKWNKTMQDFLLIRYPTAEENPEDLVIRTLDTAKCHFGLKNYTESIAFHKKSFKTSLKSFAHHLHAPLNLTTVLSLINPSHFICLEVVN